MILRKALIPDASVILSRPRKKFVSLNQADEAMMEIAHHEGSGNCLVSFLFDVDTFFTCFVFNFNHVYKDLVQLVYLLLLSAHTPLSLL